MKCDNCRKRMKVVLTNIDIKYENKDIKVLNIPAFWCPNCKKQSVHDVMVERAKNYIHLYGAENNSIDFGACERKENEDAIVVMQTLGIL